MVKRKTTTDDVPPEDVMRDDDDESSSGDVSSPLQYHMRTLSSYFSRILNANLG